MPMTFPSLLKTGPPLLPAPVELMLIWMTSPELPTTVTPFSVLSRGLSRATIPSLTKGTGTTSVFSRYCPFSIVELMATIFSATEGYPSAITVSPTLTVSSEAMPTVFSRCGVGGVAICVGIEFGAISRVTISPPHAARSMI